VVFFGCFRKLCFYLLKEKYGLFPLQVLAFRGAGGEPPRRLSSCGVSPVPLPPQESSTFRSNQPLYQRFSFQKPIKKQQSFRKEHFYFNEFSFIQ
jgi:hypothetical protein